MFTFSESGGQRLNLLHAAILSIVSCNLLTFSSLQCNIRFLCFYTAIRINIRCANMFLDIICRPVLIYKHRPVYFSKHNASETGFSLSSGKTYSVGPNG
jgi:hypothetical protein